MGPSDPDSVPSPSQPSLSLLSLSPPSLDVGTRWKLEDGRKRKVSVAVAAMEALKVSASWPL